jgi:hypothetical protein
MIMNCPNENAIRDHLIKRLDIIEPGLTLVAREHYLKNTSGASGFLDIFARAANGQLVIIEIKRTNAAAREALQELFKYAALLRQNYLVRDVDYRLIVLAVEWHELLTPYSEFAKRAPYEISAGVIILGVDGLPILIKPVTPVPAAAQRRFSTRHFLWRFADEAAAIAAVPLIAAHMQRAGLEDFVLVRSRSNDPRISENGFIYFAQQELRLAEYQIRIRAQLSNEEYEEYEEQIADLVEEEDQIAESADQIWLTGNDDFFGRIDSDTSEISHSEKAAYWFAEGAQKSIVIDRFGRFKDGGISDEAIIAELIGRGGTSDYHLDLKARTDSAPQIEALLAAVENIFFFNHEWRGATRDLVAYAQRSGPTTIRLVAFSNEDILRAIAGAAFGYPGFMPTFRFDIERIGEVHERFIGLPEWDGAAPDFDSILKSHFGEDPFGYFLAHHLGENRDVNVDIMRDLGLRYAVFRDCGNGPERIRVQGSVIVVSPQPIKGSIPSLIAANVEEVHKIVALFMEHDQGFSQIITVWVNKELQGLPRLCN